MKCSIDVVIVDFNCESLVRAVRSLERLVVDRLIIVDNGGGTDWNKVRSETEILGSELIEVHYTENMGFGAGCNRGVAYSTSAFVLFLNPDAAILQWSQPNVDALLLSGTVSVIGPNIVDNHGKPEASAGLFPGARRFAWNTLMRQRSSFRQAYLLPPGDIRYVDWVSGAALVINRALFNKLNGFDEHFFMYYEDVNLCMRVAASGAGIARSGAFLVTHDRGGTSASSLRRKYWQLRSVLRLIVTPIAS